MFGRMMRIESVLVRGSVSVLMSGALCVGLWACDEGGGASSSGAETAKPKAGGGEFVPGQTDKAAAADDKKIEFKGSAQFLPKPADWKGYTLTQGPDSYTKDTLFEIIDGASEGYLAYNFVEMVKGVYRPEKGSSDDEINVEIYKFNEPLGAFGKFGRERSSCMKKEGMGENWCLRQSDLIFWKGPYLAKVQTFDDSKEAEAAIIDAARKVEGAIKEEAQLPAMFKRLPAEGQLAGAGGFSYQALFGFEGLGSAYLMQYRPSGEAYKEDGAEVTLYAKDAADEASAAKLAASIKETLGKRKAVTDKGGVKPIEGAGEGAFVFEDDLGIHTVLVKGKTVAGGRDFKDEDTARALSVALFESL